MVELVDCTGLENQHSASYPGFESLSFRIVKNKIIMKFVKQKKPFTNFFRYFNNQNIKSPKFTKSNDFLLFPLIKKKKLITY